MQERASCSIIISFICECDLYGAQQLQQQQHQKYSQAFMFIPKRALRLFKLMHSYIIFISRE